jgi:hypothetical protein
MLLCLYTHITDEHQAPARNGLLIASGRTQTRIASWANGNPLKYWTRGVECRLFTVKGGILTEGDANGQWTG